MTTSTAREVMKRRAQPPRGTFADDLLASLNDLVIRATTLRFPNPKYQRDIVGFFREVLGIQPWDRQEDILNAVRDNDRVAICSGHKIGKSTSVAGLALWFYCSFEDARAIMSSTTSRQVDQILWRELRMLRARSGRCVRCKEQDPEGFIIPKPCPHSALIEGEQGELARTGLKSDDFREIVGFTARESEAVAGISGRNLLYLLDEASGIPDKIYEAIEGNRAGGARIVLVGNGTKNEGEFYEAFNSKKHLYKTIRVSSETTPNVISKQTLIPGLATWDWVQEKKLEWGETSSLYRVRVKGEHATFEEGKLFSLNDISEAERLWHETTPAGILSIGLDPAGEKTTGDETVFVLRRGLKMLAMYVHKGLTPADHLVHLIGHIRAHRLPREVPVVVVDREGSVGTDVLKALRAYCWDEKNPRLFDLRSVRASDGPGDGFKHQNYERVRDVLAASLRAWFTDGGAILEDVKLERELHIMEWRRSIRGKDKLIPKEEIRKILGRSCDRFDALALSVWGERRHDDDVPDDERAAARDDDELVPVHDAYAGAELWQKQ